MSRRDIYKYLNLFHIRWYTYLSVALIAAIIFADIGFVVDPQVAARLPFESISTLLKFQDGTNPALFFRAL